MEILLRVRNTFWCISCRGIRRKTSWDWDAAKNTVDALLLQQGVIAGQLLEDRHAAPVGSRVEVRRAQSIKFEDAGAWRYVDDNTLPIPDSLPNLQDFSDQVIANPNYKGYAVPRPSK